ncbi:hypothetical protein VTI74DRAFT_2268 [Chaetomium olivicolor]
MDPVPTKKAPRRKEDRVILHFDLDCFYAQCVENKQPSLKTLPLGIKQKGILATCNYVARRHGVKKLMPIAEAKKICPELVLADGEDLSPFRDVSKRLYALLRSYLWTDKAERLGLDEMFLDVTDIVSYNVELLNRNALQQSYFCLSRSDPQMGFEFDATSFAGCLYGADDDCSSENVLRLRLLLASHLAQHLRMKIEDEGYTTACGISTNKLLAKLVGDKNKPRNQTTLLALRQEDVFSFMDAHPLRKVPGIGGKTTRVLEGFVLGKEPDADIHTMECSTTVGEVRTHPGISPPALERLLSGPGSEKGLGSKVWSLLHGVDDTEVKPARDVPTQISIEDTYKGLNEPHEIQHALCAITASLLRRMHADLLDESASTLFALTNNNPNASSSLATTTTTNNNNSSSTLPPPNTTVPAPTTRSKKWLAYPRTLRLTTRPYVAPSADPSKPYNWARASRSCPLPSFVLNPSLAPEQIVERLVAETLMPLFYKLNPDPRKRGWNTGLLNVCVTNMSGVDGDGAEAGRRMDIGEMFRRQEGALREFRVYDDSGDGDQEGGVDRGDDGGDDDVRALGERIGMRPSQEEGKQQQQHWEEEGGEGDGEGNDAWEHEDTAEDDWERCVVCERLVPRFAVVAHERYHSLEDT